MGALPTKPRGWATASATAMALALFVPGALAQTDSLTLSSGVTAADGTVSLYVVLTSPPGNEPAALQWTLHYPAANVAAISATLGTSSSNASKTLSCFGNTGTYTCLVSGLNSAITNGAVAVVNLVMAAGLTTTSIPISNSFAASPLGYYIGVSSIGATITGGASPAISSLSCSPTSLPAGSSSRCTVSMSNPPGSVAVTLSSNNPALTVPANVMVHAGALRASFTATSLSSASGGIAITASFNRSSATVLLTMTAGRPEPIRVPGRQFAKLGTALRFQVSTEDPAATISAGLLPLGASFDPPTGEFRWTPEATQIGAHNINFSVIDAVGGKATASVSVQVESGDPIATAIVNGASRSRDTACSPGAIAAIEGRWLTDGATVSDASGGSTELAGTKVWANGEMVPILAASDRELDILCPDSSPGSEIYFVVQTAHGMANPLQTTARSATPGLFVPYSNALPVHSTPEGSHILLYATGIDHMTNISVQIDELQVGPASIEAVSNHRGLYRVAFAVPSAVASTHSLAVNIDATRDEFAVSLSGDAPDGSGIRSNLVKIAPSVTSR